MSTQTAAGDTILTSTPCWLRRLAAVELGGREVEVAVQRCVAHAEGLGDRVHRALVRARQPCRGELVLGGHRRPAAEPAACTSSCQAGASNGSSGSSSKRRSRADLKIELDRLLEAAGRRDLEGGTNQRRMSFSRTSRLIGPAFEHATVADAMRTGIISCQADTSLRAIAELMASYHVHAVVVETAGVESGAASGQGWGIVSDVELARAAARGELQATAGELAGSGAMFIGPAEPLRRAAELMSEHRVSHLIVSTAPTTRPVGIISTLDLAVALAWGRG